MMSDLYRSFKLLRYVPSTKTTMIIDVLYLILYMMLIFAAHEPGIFYGAVLMLAVAQMMNLLPLSQQDFSVLFRSSPHRKKMSLFAPPVFCFVSEMGLWLLLLAGYSFAERTFDSDAGGMLLVIAVYFLLTTCIYSLMLYIQYKVQGIATVLYYIVYIGLLFLVIFLPPITGLFPENDFALRLPVVSPLAATLLVLAGALLIALCLHLILRLSYRVSITQKHLDKLK